MKNRLIPHDRSVIVAADVDNALQARRLANAMKGVPRISGYKVGFELGLLGLATVTASIRDVSEDTVIIYDQQKAGTDIPKMGPRFAKRIKGAGCDGAILFPFAGPETQTVWTKSCQDAGLRVLVGGVMTHPKFLVSEGGYIADDAPERIFKLACEQGVTDFVVPGTKLEWVKKLRATLLKELGEGNFVLYAPGLIDQGGDITECGLAAGPYFHGIIGEGIYGKSTEEAMHTAALAATQKLAT